MDLEYRGEGSAAMVFALPKSNEVLRLIKSNTVKKIRKDLKTAESGKTNLQGIQLAVKMQLENVIDYVQNMMKPLFSDQFVVVPTLTKVPSGFTHKALHLTRHERPAHRKHSPGHSLDADILWAFLLPDCCFLRHNATTNSSSSHGRNTGAIAGSSDVTTFLENICGSELGPNKGCDSISGHNHNSDSDTLQVASQNHSSSESIGTTCLVNGFRTCDGDNGNSPHNRHNGNSPCNRDYRNSPCDGDNISQMDQELRKQTSSALGDKADIVKLSKDHIHVESNSEKFSSVSPNLPDTSTDFTLSFEIKPKKAYMLPQPTGQGGKPQVCKFCMHQCLKQLRRISKILI